MSLFKSTANLAAQRKARPPSRIPTNMTIRIRDGVPSLDNEEPVIEATKPVVQFPSIEGFKSSDEAHMRLDYVSLASKTWGLDVNDSDLIVHDAVEYKILNEMVRPYLTGNQGSALTDLQKNITKVMKGTFRKSR